MSATINELENELDGYIESLRTNFIAKFIPAQPEHKPEYFEHVVKAYCVLAHAAFEEFVEVISTMVMSNAIDAWKTNGNVTRPLLALALYYRKSICSVDDEDAPQETCFNAVRLAIDEIKKEHSRAIHENHGFSLTYLRRTLTPVFIDVTTEIRLTNSLRTLADARGSYAHTSAKYAIFIDKTKAKRPMTPETARDTVNDCLELCKKISAAAIAYFPP